MKTICLAVAAGLMLAIPSTTAGCEGSSQLESQIIWRDRDSREVLFLPESVINATTTLEELPISQDQLRGLEIARDRRVNPERYYPPHAIRLGLIDCFGHSDGDAVQGSAEGARSLPELIEMVEVAFIGRVVKTIQGYSFRSGGVSRAVYVTPGEYLSIGQNGEAPDGMQVYLELGGTIRVHGVELCQNRSQEFYTAREGDDVLILAARSGYGQSLLNVEWMFPIVDGTVKPQPYAYLTKSQDAVTLTELREHLLSRS